MATGVGAVHTAARVPRLAVAFVISSLGSGGAERVVVLLAAALAELGHRVAIVTLDPSQPDFHRAPPGVERIAVAAAGASRSLGAALANNLVAVGRLARALARQRPEVVVAFGDTTNVKALLAGAVARVPVVVSERVDPDTVAIGRAWSRLRDATYRRAAALVVQTSSVRPWAARRIDPARVVVIGNPVAMPAAPTADRDRDRDREIVAIGRLVPQKGFDVLLPAFAALPDRSWRLSILGDGPLRAALQAQRDALGLGDRVTFTGVVDDVARRLARAGLFVLPSRFEGFPNALVEAMSHGVPVVASDCPSGPAEILAGVDAPLCPVGDVAALRDAMAAMIADAPRRARCGAQARARAEAFAVPVVADAWERLLVRVAGR
jgi:glycosyltransferase involved in cell wall biosynthesis